VDCYRGQARQGSGRRCAPPLIAGFERPLYSGTDFHLQGNPSAMAIVSGYHDPTGNREHNRELAKQRALGVRDHLIGKGIGEARIELAKPIETMRRADEPLEKTRRRVLREEFSGAMNYPMVISRRLVVAALVIGAPSAMSQGNSPMTQVASGTFSVEMKPQGEPNAVDGVSLGRMSLNKKFEGDLQGTGQGEMLTALTPIKDSAGYVAIERFTGTVHGRSGSFVFQHSGTMNQGAQQLSIAVVPGSGTGALLGITGTFRLNIVDGKHLYEFEYTLPQ
jgi:hypothetical protein